MRNRTKINVPETLAPQAFRSDDLVNSRSVPIARNAIQISDSSGGKKMIGGGTEGAP